MGGRKRAHRTRPKEWRAQGKHWGELAWTIRVKSQVRTEWEKTIECQHRHERAKLVRERGRQSRGVEQEADRSYRSAMRGPVQVGADEAAQLTAFGSPEWREELERSRAQAEATSRPRSSAP